MNHDVMYNVWLWQFYQGKSSGLNEHKTNYVFHTPKMHLPKWEASQMCELLHEFYK